MHSPSIFVIRHKGIVNYVETWSRTPSGDGIHHRTFRALEEAKAWFSERGAEHPEIRERPY